MKDKKTPEEIAHAEKRDAIMKERPQEWEHIQKERQKIRDKKTEEALKQQAEDNKIIKFEQPAEGTKIGGMESFHVEKGEERHTYQIVTKREITFSYLIRAKNEEDAMIRTLSFVSKDGSGQREDV
jgi:transcription elongation GreA/GreB family factor